MLKTSKDQKSHMSTTDLCKDVDTQDNFNSPNEKSRNKHLSPFTVHNVAQRTARERKVKQLDKLEDEKKPKDDLHSYLPQIIKTPSDIDSEFQ